MHSERWRYEFRSEFLVYLLRVENRLMTLTAEDTRSLCSRQLCFMCSNWISLCIQVSGFSMVLGFPLFIDSGVYTGFDQ